MTRGHLLILLFLLHTVIFAQKPADSAKIMDQDSVSALYKEKLDKYVGMRLDANTNVSKFSFINSSPIKNFDVAPNQDYEARIAVNYKWLTLAFSFSPKIGSLNDQERDKGTTKITGVDFSFNLKKTQHRLFITNTKGYYLANSDIYRKELADYNIYTKYAKLPNFKSLQLGSENFYFLNSNQFSKVFARDKSEIQLKSAGSWVTFFGLYYSKIDGRDQDLSFLQNMLDPAGSYPTVNESYYGSLGMGYGYNLILAEHFFVTALAIPSAGLQYSHSEYSQNTAHLNRKELTVGLLTETSFGYNTKEWFTGLLANYTSYTSTTVGNKMVGSKGYFTMFVGYRIPPPRVVKRTFDYIQKRLER